MAAHGDGGSERPQHLPAMLIRSVLWAPSRAPAALPAPPLMHRDYRQGGRRALLPVQELGCRGQWGDPAGTGSVQNEDPEPIARGGLQSGQENPAASLEVKG